MNLLELFKDNQWVITLIIIPIIIWVAKGKKVFKRELKITDAEVFVRNFELFQRMLDEAEERNERLKETSTKDVSYFQKEVLKLQAERDRLNSNIVKQGKLIKEQEVRIKALEQALYDIKN